jgi:hypothetical protein
VQKDIAMNGDSRLQPSTERPAREQKALALLRRWYRDGSQNGKSHPVNSMYTRGRGAAVFGLGYAQALDWIKSEPDSRLNKRGWRHDITPAGRAALEPEKPL